MSPSPVLVTERLELWRPAAGDLAELAALVSHPDVYRWLGGPQPMSDHFARLLRNAGSWQLYGYGSFMVRLRGGDGRIVGNCGVFHSWRGLGEDFDDRAEAGWIIAANEASRGLATEAMSAALGWFDEAFGEATVCMIVQGNAPSIRLSRKLDYFLIRDAELPTGEAVHLYCREAR